MDLRRLEIFNKLMETKSFSRTAEELALTQPTVSGHIKTLEEELELRLFDRRQRQILPTSAAFVLKDYAQRILDLRTEVFYALDQFKGRISGRLKLGGSTIPGGYILPIVIGRFCRLYPETHLNLVLGDTQGIVNRIVEGGIEIGIIGARVTLKDLEYETLLEDEMVLAAPPGHTWTESAGPIPVTDLAKTPFVIREQGSGTRAAMLAALAGHGLGAKDLNIVSEMGSTEAVIQAIKAGLGVSILSRFALAQDIRFNLIKAVPIKGLNLRRPFYIVTHKKRTRSPLCGAFLDFLRKQGRKAAAELTEQT